MNASANAPWLERLIDRLMTVYVTVFLCLFVTGAVYALAEEVPLFRMPIQLFMAMLVPIVLRVHAIDCIKHGAQSTITLLVDHRHTLLPFLSIVALAILNSLRPGAYLEDGDSKVVLIFALRLAMFVGGLSTAVLLWNIGWRPVMRLVLLVFIGSVFYELAYPGSFSGVGSRAAGFQANPNLSALTTMLLLAFAVRYERVYLLDLALIVASFLALYGTLSRSGMLTFTLFVLNYLYYTGRGERLRQLVWVPIIGVVIVPIAIAAMSQLTASSEIFATDNAQRRVATLALESDAVYQTDDIRLGLIPTYLGLIDQAPLFGHGTGFSRSMPFGPHNIYLDFWVNNGFVGLICYIWFVVGLFWLSFSRDFPSGATFAVIAMFGGFFNHTVFQMPVFLIVAGLSMGLSWCSMMQLRVETVAGDAAVGGIPRPGSRAS